MDGRGLIALEWSVCFSNELQLRKEAIRLCKEHAYGIQATLWASLNDKEHRVKHWLQLVAIPNSGASSHTQEMQELTKRIADLEKARSLSPSRSSQGQQKPMMAITGPSFLALPAPDAGSAPVPKGGEGTSNKNKGKGTGKVASSTPHYGSCFSNPVKNFNYIMKCPAEVRNFFNERFHRNEICCNVQRKGCKKQEGSCKFAQICVGCGGSKPCDDCLCLTESLNYFELLR